MNGDADFHAEALAIWNDPRWVEEMRELVVEPMVAWILHGVPPAWMTKEEIEELRQT